MLRFAKVAYFIGMSDKIDICSFAWIDSSVYPSDRRPGYYGNRFY